MNMMSEFERIAAQARDEQTKRDVQRFREAAAVGDLATMTEISKFADGDAELQAALWAEAIGQPEFAEMDEEADITVEELLEMIRALRKEFFDE